MLPTLLLSAAIALLASSCLYLARIVRYQTEPSLSARWAHGVGAALATAAAIVGMPGGETFITTTPLVLLIVAVALAWLALVLEVREATLLGAAAITQLAAAAALAVFFKLHAGTTSSGAGVTLETVTVLHISATILGYLLFIPPYHLSVLYLGQSYRLKTKQLASTRLPSLVSLERTSWSLLYAGFPLFTIGILLGAVWQESDTARVVKPQQILAAVAWCIYAYTIFRRLRSGWAGKRAAVALMAAFVTTSCAVLLYVMR